MVLSKTASPPDEIRVMQALRGNSPSVISFPHERLTIHRHYASSRPSLVGLMAYQAHEAIDLCR